MRLCIHCKHFDLRYKYKSCRYVKRCEIKQDNCGNIGCRITDKEIKEREKR